VSSILMKSSDLMYICGSRLLTDPIVFRKNVTALANSTREKLKDRKISTPDKHNIFTAYCLKLLGYGTGHRPVTDMFAFREDIDLEENIVVINDKISSKLAENRVCWLSEIASSQFVAYSNHLISLSKILKQENHNELSSIIYGLLDQRPAHKQSIPLFFFLSSDYEVESITPTRLSELLPNTWPYEDNHNRHYLESYLSKNNISSGLIDIQLGHLTNHQHPFGFSRSWTPAECAEILKPALNHLSIDQRWDVINGLDCKTDTHLTKIYPRPNKEYGHIARASTRQHRLNILEKKIKDIVVGEISKSGSIANYIENIKAQETTIETILTECLESEDFTYKTIEIFINIINKLARENKVTPIKKLNIAKQEHSPFSAHWLNSYIRSRQLRTKFTKFLSRSEQRSKTTAEYSWATIIISAVLFSGVYRFEWINYILKSGPSSIRKIKNWLYYIDIWCDDIDKKIKKEYQSPSWRWFPDPLSRSLLLHHLKNENSKTSRKIDTKKVELHIHNILSDLGFTNKDSSTSLQSLTNVLQSYWTYHFPPFICGIFNSELKTSPLPERTLARLIYKKKLSSYIDISDDKTFIEKSRRPNRPKRNLKEYLTLIKLSINATRSKNKTSPSKQLDDLKYRLIEIHENNQFPNISIALSQWLLHMIDYGGSRKSELVINTIDEYFFSIAHPLCIYIGHNDIEEYNEEEIAVIYTKAINYNNVSQHLRASQLFRFNLICSNYGLFDFSELNWREIAGKWLSKKETRVDSNIVTPEEYYQSLQLLQNSKLDTYTKSWACMALILGYRFSLRIGECHHLRVQDVQQLSDQIIIQVQRTIKGRKKSQSAIRQIPLLGNFKDIEFNVLNTHMSMIKNSPDYSIDSFIFQDTENIGELIPRQNIWELLHSVLRTVTGDPRIRYQHLRHSFITAQFSSNLPIWNHLVFSESNHSLWHSYRQDINKHLVNPATPNANTMYALSVSVGHKDFSTSLHSYIHTADDISAAYVRSTSFPEITVNELARITGHNEKTLKSRIRTKKMNKQPFSPMDVLASIQVGNEIPAYNFKLEKYPKRLNYEPKLRNLRVYDIYDILKSSGIHNTSTENIAFFKQTDAHSINKILNTAKSISDTNHFDVFNIRRPAANGWLPKKTNKLTSSIDLEKTNIISLIHNIDNLIKNPNTKSIFEAGCKSWINSINLHTTGSTLIFTTPDNLISFIKACKIFGYESTHFKYSYSDQLSESNVYHLKNILNNIGIQDIKPEKTRRLESGIDDQRLNFVKSTLNKNIPRHMPKKLFSLSQIFYVLSVFFNLR